MEMYILGLQPFSVGNATSSTNTSTKSRNLDFGTHSQRDFTHPTESYNQGTDYGRNLMDYTKTNTDYSRSQPAAAEYPYYQMAAEYNRVQAQDYSRSLPTSMDTGRTADYGRTPIGDYRDVRSQPQDYSRIDYSQQRASQPVEYNRSQLDYLTQLDYARSNQQQQQQLAGRDYGNYINRDYINIQQANRDYVNHDFIQGAISNRTLEQLTEVANARPYRAIRAEHKMPTTTYVPTSWYLLL